MTIATYRPTDEPTFEAKHEQLKKALEGRGGWEHRAVDVAEALLWLAQEAADARARIAVLEARLRSQKPITEKEARRFLRQASTRVDTPKLTKTQERVLEALRKVGSVPGALSLSQHTAEPGKRAVSASRCLEMLGQLCTLKLVVRTGTGWSIA